MQYWLFKSEPSTFSIDDLKRRPKKTEHWDGVRNFQVRNMLKDQIKKGDQCFFYHSSCSPPGIAGVVEVVREGYPDFTAFDPLSKYWDPRSKPEKPLWYMVDVKFVEKFPDLITLTELRNHKQLQDMLILRRGNRLSITPVTTKQWNTILGLIKNK